MGGGVLVLYVYFVGWNQIYFYIKVQKLEIVSSGKQSEQPGIVIKSLFQIKTRPLIRLLKTFGNFVLDWVLQFSTNDFDVCIAEKFFSLSR